LKIFIDFPSALRDAFADFGFRIAECGLKDWGAAPRLSYSANPQSEFRIPQSKSS
jgi:hypothetical protein